MELNDATENVLQNKQQNNELNAMLDDVLNTLAETIYNPPSASAIPASPASSSPTFTNLSHSNIPNLENIRLKIVEQPALKGLRFRYICEGRSAGSIPGVHSTPENKTFPTIEVEGYEGKVKVVVSCVTKDEPYRPHPHNLVGKEGCEHGVCLATISGPPMRAVFSNLGIQCVKKKDIKAALEERERKRIDPFKTSFAHKDHPSSIDLNVVRLCFQAFIPIPGVKKPFPIPPVISDPIFDKKSINDLVICRLCSCAAKVTGGDIIILLCEKVPKDDIKVRFFEMRNNELYWEDFGEFQQTDVHKQAAITFKTPRYINCDVNHRVQVNIQLYRPSDGETSEALQFEFYPDPGMRTFPHIQRKLKHIEDMEIFQQILSLDSETAAIKYTISGVTDNDNDNEDTITSDSSASKPKSSETLNEYDGSRRQQRDSFVDDKNDADKDDDNDDTDSYNYNIECKNGNMEIEFPVPKIALPTKDDFAKTSTSIQTFLKDREIDSRDLPTYEFKHTDRLIIKSGNNLSLTGATDISKFGEVRNQDTISVEDDIILKTDLIQRDTELEDKLYLQLLTKHERADQPKNFTNYNKDLNFSASTQGLRTTPLQGKPSYENKKLHENFENGLVVLKNPPAPKIKVNVVRTPPTPSSPLIPLPPRTLPIREEILSPLISKRKPSQELSTIINKDTSSCYRTSISRNGSIISRPPSQIIIMRTPDQSPTKRSASCSLSPKKKGFFSRFFSRKKSKCSTGSSAGECTSKMTTPNQSREPSIGNFSINDKSSSMRSVNSLQQNSIELEPKFNYKTGNVVGRSASSNSGKRPAQRNADIIHIPLKVDTSESLSKQRRRYSNSCTLRYDGGLLDRKTLSALQLADIPISDGNMELIAIADRQSIKNLCEGAYGVVLDPSVDLSEAEHFALYTSLPSQGDNSYNENLFANQPILTPEEVAMRLAAANDNIKRKRIKTGGNPINLLREIQQLEQNQTQFYVTNSNVDSSPIWNMQPSIQSPLSNASTVPEVKAEPFLSPNYYEASYRNTYLTSPSPQPSSPMMSRNITTPSPGLIRNSSAENQTQMTNRYNQNQINHEQYQNFSNSYNLSQSNQGTLYNTEYNMFDTPNTLFESSNSRNFNMTASQQQAQLTTSNIFVNRTSGGSFTPIYASDNGNASNNKIQTTNVQFDPMNMTNNMQQVQAALGSANNMMFNQYQDSNITGDSSLLNLSQLDDLVPLQNSEELRISNLSIST